MSAMLREEVRPAVSISNKTMARTSTSTRGAYPPIRLTVDQTSVEWVPMGRSNMRQTAGDTRHVDCEPWAETPGRTVGWLW